MKARDVGGECVNPNFKRQMDVYGLERNQLPFSSCLPGAPRVPVCLVAWWIVGGHILQALWFPAPSQLVSHSWVVCLSQPQVQALGSPWAAWDGGGPSWPSLLLCQGSRFPAPMLSLCVLFLLPPLSPPVCIPPFAPQGSQRPQTRPTSSLRALRPL